MKSFRASFALFLLICAGFLNPWAYAEDTTNEPPKSVLETIPDAHRMGKGTLRWLGLRIYDAQLWSNTDATSFDYKRHLSWLELKYARSFKGKDIAQRSREEMQKLGVADDEQLAKWEAELTRIFPDVQKGHTLSMLYRPGKGLDFFRNGAPLAKIDDPQLSAAFVGIWLDPKTSAPDVRKQLIGLTKQ